MKSTIGVYASHKKAIEAIRELKDSGYPVQQVSLIGKAKIIDDHMHISQNRWMKDGPVSIGVILGPILGVLTGAGIFSIPGLGFIFGAGAVIGAFAGFDIGLVGGGIVSLLTTLGMKRDEALKYHEHLEEKRFLVVAQGNQEQVRKAREILHDHHSEYMVANCH